MKQLRQTKNDRETSTGIAFAKKKRNKLKIEHDKQNSTRIFLQRSQKGSALKKDWQEFVSRNRVLSLTEKKNEKCLNPILSFRCEIKDIAQIELML